MTSSVRTDLAWLVGLVGLCGLAVPHWIGSPSQPVTKTGVTAYKRAQCYCTATLELTPAGQDAVYISTVRKLLADGLSAGVCFLEVDGRDPSDVVIAGLKDRRWVFKNQTSQD